MLAFYICNERERRAVKVEEEELSLSECTYGFLHMKGDAKLTGPPVEFQ